MMFDKQSIIYKQDLRAYYVFDQQSIIFLEHDVYIPFSNT